MSIYISISQRAMVFTWERLTMTTKSLNQTVEASHQLKSLCMILDLRLLKVRIVQLRDIVLILEVISGLILLDQVLDLVPEAQYPKAIQ